MQHHVSFFLSAGKTNITFAIVLFIKNPLY